MLPISVNSWGPAWAFGLENAYRVIKEAGFDAVDATISTTMSYAETKQHRLPAFMTTGSDKDLLATFDPWREGARAYGLCNYQAHAPYPTLIGHDANDPFNEDLLQALIKYIRVCDYIDCRRLVVHPAYCSYQYRLDPQREWEINMERYAAMIPEAKKYGVMILLENMFVVNQPSGNPRAYASACSDIPTACRYIDELNALAGEKVFGFCLDTGHLMLLGKNLKESMIQLGDRIEALHIDDNDGITDQHLSPYMGVTDWDDFCEGLKAIHYRKTINFEVGNLAIKYPKELYPHALKLLAETGRMFARRALGED